METIYIVCEIKGIHDPLVSLLKSFRNKASADHFLHDKECEMNKYCWYYIKELELI